MPPTKVGGGSARAQSQPGGRVGNPERGGATGKPERSLEHKIPTERYVNGVYEIPLSLNVCVIPSFNTTLRYSNEQVEY